MEELLKPQALEKFANITSLYGKFGKLQQARLIALGNGLEFPVKDEGNYQKLREELTAEVESVQFHQQKIEYLVDQLYAFNRRLTTLGGADAAPRRAPQSAPARTFSTIMSVSSSMTAGWSASPRSTRSGRPLPAPKPSRSSASRAEVAEIAQATGTSLPEFRRIVNMVQKGEREARIAKKEMVEAISAS